MNWKTHLREVFHTLLIAFAIVSFWRGTWGLMDLYLFPENHLVSFWISILIGVVILYSTQNLFKRLI
ncbi:hypothetical protein HY448_00065 [Candidatus Pacearchaeota archaeon]|nr:hypothetical protein [Candidatus Pacearchaeota archaeon]